ncbi:hypothetical protein POSPLADRAFT_1154850 [Postia placenta MAD-698-R-SB12]|uniref:Uncharacterized protein n=1 Tax=Postia placenta MAD-698-R-SB12 TaxID=670580 RepID=A0A1X6MP22_9APHY|nr:hypothetical protein POSPLADRAFT_1154850 [Postia placenta MAD-698-R-SB12]OSX58088.1 hypothetical protein POSPLADRAFT_1154850 [Postia placenta MAD-698-R-SB12]
MGEDITGVGGDGGRCGGGGGCGGPPLVELREERVLERPLGGISSYLTGLGDSLGKAGGRGDRARVPRGRSRCKGASRAERMLCSADRLVAQVIFCDRSGCPVGARLLLTAVDDSLRAVWDVDVDEVLRVECVNLALAGSHVGWGEDGKEPSPHVHKDKHRPLKCRGAHHPTCGKGR